MGVTEMVVEDPLRNQVFVSHNFKKLYKSCGTSRHYRIGSSSFSIIRIGLVARICRSQSSKDGQFRQGRGSIPRFGIVFFAFVPG
jgi:hypothetical protein